MEDDTYLRCTDCGWALPLETTPAGERCPECNGALDVVRDSDECPRCQQQGGAIVCPRCRELDRERQGEVARLFTPAPAQLAGQLELNAGTSTE